MINNKKGSVLAYTVIILGVVTVIAFTASATAGLNVLANSYTQTKSIEVRQGLYGCMDEMLFQLKIDLAHDPSTITVGDITCDVTVTDTALDTKDLDFTYSVGTITRRLHAEIEFVPIVVTRVIEE